MARPVRIAMHLAHDANKFHVVVVVPQLGPLLQVARNKFRSKISRLFLPSGFELLDATIAAVPFTDGMKLYVSKGEDYRPPLAPSQRGEAGAPLPPPQPPAQPPTVRVVARRSWIDNDAVLQLKRVARNLAGVRLAVGMPDLHPGKGYPIGACIATTGVLYPHLVGGDCGCGMSLVQTNLRAEQVMQGKQLDKWVRALRGLESQWGGNVARWKSASLQWPEGGDAAPVNEAVLRAAEIDPAAFDSSLGTIGGGNHFAELQRIERVDDEAEFARLRLDRDALFLLVHSGSRGLGGALLDHHASRHGRKGLRVDSDDARRYLALHTETLHWARRNRALIAERFVRQLGSSLAECRCVLDVFHNFVCEKLADLEVDGAVGALAPALPLGPADAKEAEEEEDDEEEEEGEEEEATAEENGDGDGDSHDEDDEEDEEAKEARRFRPPEPASAPAPALGAAARQGHEERVMLHRKGATPSDCGPVVIPGSRGAYSFLVVPTGPQALSAFSLAHGAGRKWSRGKALSRMRGRYRNPTPLLTTSLGSAVICEDKELLYEEAPEAYKEVTEIVQDLVDKRLVRVVAVLRPVITYKMRAGDAE